MSTITTSRLLTAGLAPFDWQGPSWLPLLGNPIRIEEYLDGQAYVLRVEAPGVDPAKDVTITYQEGTLRLEIRRGDERAEKAHSEFHYGVYGRTVTLPAGVAEKSIHATYTNGILEITATIVDSTPGQRAIPVTVTAARPTTNGAKH
jgi:HSP20 family protein